jgi:hypothetical protein
MKKVKLNRWVLKLLFLTVAACALVDSTYAQPVLPQRVITVSATQSIHFGTFCLTGASGGTVSVGYNGSRNSTGDIYLSPLSPLAQPAIFEIKLCQGRNVTITFDPTTILTGSNGGSFILDIGPTEKGVSGSEFPVNNDCNFITTIRVGGTLHIPGGAPQGTYSGSFEITFEQE